MATFSIFFLLCLAVSTVTCFYFPGVSPNDYQQGQSVEVSVNTLTSTETIFPYDYYLPNFHFCLPSDGVTSRPESLASILLGDRLYNSAFRFKMMEEQTCQRLCSVKVPAEDAQFINQRIKEQYSVNMMVDHLPVAHIVKGPDTNGRGYFYKIGFHLGFIGKDEKAYFNNHHEFDIKYHEHKPGVYRVIEVLVRPQSYGNPNYHNQCDSKFNAPIALSEEQETEVFFTYAVKWTRSNQQWATRWDVYASGTNSRIHWFSIINSFLVLFFLSALIAVVLLRSLRHDIAQYNVDEEDSVTEDFGWKLVHGDVFRAPGLTSLLCATIGNGVHIMVMGGLTLFLAMCGAFSPAVRGSLGTSLIVLYILLSSVPGYVAARFYQMYGGEKRRVNMFLTAVGLPGGLFVSFLFLNFFLIAAKSSAALPFGTMVALTSLWFLISAPLNFLGALFAYRKPAIENPCKTNKIPRQIPHQPVFLKEIFTVISGGLLPFGAILIELYFIMNSIWHSQIYFMYGFLFLVFFILMITCAEVSILLTYTQLCSEDYRWAWRSFRTTGACGVYLFIFATYFGMKRLDLSSTASVMLFMGWTGIFSSLLAVFTGTIGFLASFWFIRKIFSSIKVD